MKKIFIKGFTLIELLVVIAILGIIMAAVVAGIDPIDKINAANDAKVQADIGALGTAFEANATLAGTYAANQAALISGGDLKVTLTAPTGYTCPVTNNTTYNVGGGGTSQYVSCTLKSKKYVNANTPLWIWCSSNGKASAQAAGFTCP